MRYQLHSLSRQMRGLINDEFEGRGRSRGLYNALSQRSICPLGAREIRKKTRNDIWPPAKNRSPTFLILNPNATVNAFGAYRLSGINVCRCIVDLSVFP